MKILESLQIAIEADHTGLTEEQKEDKIIRLVDFLRFKECTQMPVQVINCVNYEICLVGVDSLLKGFVFLDKKSMLKELSGSTGDIVKRLKALSKETGIENLWCIFVEERHPDFLDVVHRFLLKTNLSDIAEKVFLLDFFGRSVIEL